VVLKKALAEFSARAFLLEFVRSPVSRREERREHYARGGSQATQQRRKWATSIAERHGQTPRRNVAHHILVH
jgi:hypothetical protein